VLSLVFVPSFYVVMEGASRATGRLFGRAVRPDRVPQAGHGLAAPAE
jgi:hypothetical protein